MNKVISEGLTFDDVLVVPGKMTVDIGEINTKTKFSKNINLNIPLVSAGMDSVTESRMAISIARQGGIGIIHSNLTIEEQANEVDKVKRSEHGVITDPFSLSPNHYIYQAEELMAKYHISGVPITEHGILVGILTNRDLRFEENYNKKIYEVMTRDNLITAPEGTDIEGAKKILMNTKVEKLPIVDDKMYLKGLVTIKDIQKSIKYPNSAKDENGRLLVAAAVNINADMWERVDALYKAKVNAIVIAEAHGHTTKMVEAVKLMKEKYPNLDVIAGNVVTAEGTKALIEAGADAVRVGLGAGSTCTTRIVAGVGVPQISAISDCYEVAKEYNVPIVSDGGITYSGDITKAITAGASSIVLGSIIAGSDESPGDVELLEGRKYKVYRGIGSESALRDRDGKETFISDGVDARVSYKGKVQETLAQLIGGLKLGMSYAGARTVEDLKNDSKFVKITGAGLKESHPHTVKVTRESVNYSTGL